MCCDLHRYKSGSVLIVNTERNGQVVQRLRGHDEEIHGVCWCPELGEEPDWIAEKGLNKITNINTLQRKICGIVKNLYLQVK